MGAGLFVKIGAVVLANCTLVSNSVAGGEGGPYGFPQMLGFTVNGDHGDAYGGGIYNYQGTVTLLNSCVAGNSAYTGSDLTGAFVSSGHNLIGNNEGATNLSILDLQNVPANLGPLQDNGGPTLTCAPLQGSPAIDNANSTGAPGTDQRGVPRPQGAVVDIGALEAVTGSPLMTDAAMLGSGFYLTTILDATNSYRLQGSTTLTNWIDLTNYATGGSQRFVDSTATNLNRRFYRTAAP
ncbi:MAG: hypothetical protein KJ070_01075 [Verrucomicrobia bacterium]|nr:hypothetical protein [Verrucomicrobiota bacterium]